MVRPKRSSTRRIAISKGFRSGLEHQLSEDLIKLEIPFGYESLKVTYTQPAKDRVYTPDFILQKSGGAPMLIETKGYWPAADRIKMKLIVASNPNLDIRILFQNPNTKTSKKSKTTYGMVAEKLGLKWDKYTGGLPMHWIEELA